MELTVWNEKDRLHILLCGEIDHHAVKDAREEVDRMLLKTHPRSLVMDLSQIDFIDSSGLGFILGRLRKIKDIGGELFVLNPARRVEEMLKMAGADKLVKIARSKEQIS